MSEFIDREKAIANIKAAYCCGCEHYNGVRCRACQIMDAMDVLEELNEDTRLLIYPSIHAVLMGDSVRELLNSFSEEENIGEDTAVQGAFEDMPE